MTDEKQIHIYSGKLFPWQRESAQLLLRFRRNLIYTILSPRQCGKTYFLCMYALAAAINHKNHRVVFVNPTFSNSRRTYAELVKYTTQMPPEAVENTNASELQIKFFNGSTIQLKSIEQGNGLRGDHANTLIIDEAAFISTTEALTLLFPYCNATQGNIILVSTPTFRDESNLFYKFFKMAQDGGNTGYIRYSDWTKFDLSPILSNDKKELLKSAMPFNIYLNEIEGQFLTEKSELWDISPILKNGVVATPKMVAGLDWATCGTDSTVLQVFNSNNQNYRLLKLDRNTPPTEQVNIILATLKELHVDTLVYESNSIGFPMADFMKKEATKQRLQTRFVAFNTSNESKRRIIEEMQILIQNQQITLLNNNDLKLQFVHFEMKSTPTGKITYGNDDDRNNDDIVIATALALQAGKTGTYNVK